MMGWVKTMSTNEDVVSNPRCHIINIRRNQGPPVTKFDPDNPRLVDRRNGVVLPVVVELEFHPDENQRDGNILENDHLAPNPGVFEPEVEGALPIPTGAAIIDLDEDLNGPEVVVLSEEDEDDGDQQIDVAEGEVNDVDQAVGADDMHDVLDNADNVVVQIPVVAAVGVDIAGIEAPEDVSDDE